MGNIWAIFYSWDTESPEINVFDVVGVEKVYWSVLVSLGYRGVFGNYICARAGNELSAIGMPISAEKHKPMIGEDFSAIISQVGGARVIFIG